MKSKLWIANLGFIPRSYDLALLFLRLALGMSMIALHGWGKLTGFGAALEDFPNPLGIGRHLSLILAITAELLGSALLIIGALSRLAAALLAINMSVALFMVHHGDMTRSGGGEPAALYLFGYITILLAGGGRFSADGAGGPWALAAFGGVAGALVGLPLSYAFQPSHHPLAGSLSDYLANLRGVMRDDSLRPVAVGVWIGSIVLFAVAGWFIGRAMYRERRREVTVSIPPPQTPE